jgi:hypothetical protein
MARQSRLYAGTIGVALIVPVAVAAALLDTGRASAPASTRDATANLGQSAVATFTTGGIADSYPGDVGIEAHPDVIFVERFDEGDLNGLFSRWTDILNGNAMSFTSDLPPGSPGPASLNIPWVGGGVNNGGHLYKQISPGVDDTLYVRYYIKYPTTGRYSHNGIWVGGYNPPIPWPNPQAGLKPAGNDRFAAAAEQNSVTMTFDHYDYWMDMRQSLDGNYWGNVLLNDPNVKGASGKWMCVEQMVKLNTPVSASNGEHAIWIDGARISHVGEGFPNGSWSGGTFTQSSTGTPFPGLRWRSDPSLNINYIWLQNYAPDDPAGFFSSMKFAHVVAAKSYVGCLSPATGGDTTPPTVSISAPGGGATVSGVVTLTAAASDNVGVAGVQFKLDDANLGAEDLTAPYTISWDTTAASAGSHILTAVARDTAGNGTTSAGVGVTVLAPPDVTAPTVAISTPVAGATVANTVAVSATASDNVAVAGVQFKLDGANLGAEVSGAPYAVAWNTQGSRDLVFGVTKVAVGGMTISAGSGFTKRLRVSCPSCSGDDMMSEDKVQTAAGSAAATFTFSTAAHYLAQMAAFKAAGTPGYVQGAAATSQPGTPTIVKTFGSPITAGNLIVVAVAWQGNAALNVTDSQGNVYAGATTAYDAINDQTLAIVYAANVKGGATTVTAGFGGAVPSVERLEIHEYAGLATANPLDATAATIGDGVTTANTVTSGSATTTVSPTAKKGAHTLTAVARDTAGNRTTSAGVRVTVLNDTAPPVVSAVTASALTTSGATITWMTNEASDSQVEYGLTTSYGSASALSANLVASHVVGLSGLAAGTPYHYRVRSRDVAGNLAVSGDVLFTTLAAPDVTPPTVAISAPAAGTTVANTVAVTATASDNVGVAGVQFKLDGANLGAEDTTSPYSVSWNTSTSSSGAHTVTAVARDAAGNLASSTPVTVVVAQPTAQVILGWNTNPEPDLAGYKVYVGTASGIYSSPLDVGNITSFTVTGLTPGTAYYFAVSAYDLNGYESSWSNEVSAIR